MQETGTIRIVVTGKNLDITPALREHVEKKVGKLTRFFSDEGQSIMAEAVLALEKDLHLAEVTLKVRSLLVRGESKTGDMYSSVDEAVDRIERQIRKYKTRIQKRLQGRPKLGELHANAVPQQPAEADEDELPRVVRTKRFAMKPMEVEEAIMQMELLGHNFFVFAHADTDDVNVVYRRRDGNYGLIEPE